MKSNFIYRIRFGWCVANTLLWGFAIFTAYHLVLILRHGSVVIISTPRWFTYVELVLLGGVVLLAVYNLVVYIRAAREVS